MFELLGVEEFLTALKKKATLLESQQEQIIMAGATILQEEIKERAPYRTGNLKTNIIITKLKKDGEAGYVYVGPYENRANIFQLTGFYGRMHEFGTSKMQARPFVEPSYLSKKSAMLAAMAQEAKRVIGGV